jgi:hypothetical protein
VEEIAAVAQERGLLPLIDFAYQGFGDGLIEDAAGLREFAKPGRELLVCSSFSKNFGLYGERVGALTLVAADADAAQRALSQVRISVRTNYSNPPTHGAAIVAGVLADALRKQWEQSWPRCVAQQCGGCLSKRCDEALARLRVSRRSEGNVLVRPHEPGSMVRTKRRLCRRQRRPDPRRRHDARNMEPLCGKAAKNTNPTLSFDVALLAASGGRIGVV